VYLGLARRTGGDLAYIADKVAHLRIFPDAQGKMNLSVTDLASRSWWSPSSRCTATPGTAAGLLFLRGPAGKARELYLRLIRELRSRASRSGGEFAASMK